MEHSQLKFDESEPRLKSIGVVVTLTVLFLTATLILTLLFFSGFSTHEKGNKEISSSGYELKVLREYEVAHLKTLDKAIKKTVSDYSKK